MQVRKKSKKPVIMLLSLLLVGIIAFGGTLAYLTAQTQKRTNNFTFPEGAEGLSAMLTEPNWDGVVAYESVTDSLGGIRLIPIYGYQEDDGKPIYGYKNGDITSPVTDKSEIDSSVTRPQENINASGDNESQKQYGEDLAKVMIPGQTVYKNPIVTNTGSLIDEWVAVKVTFVYSKDYTDGSKTYKKGAPLSNDDVIALTRVIKIDTDYDGTKWEKIYHSVSGDQVDSEEQFVEYYYKELVHTGEVTKPLFNTVRIPENITTKEYEILGHLTKTGFTIYIEGFAAQSAVASNYDSFKAWGKAGNVVFNNTPSDEEPAIVDTPYLPADTAAKE